MPVYLPVSVVATRQCASPSLHVHLSLWLCACVLSSNSLSLRFRVCINACLSFCLSLSLSLSVCANKIGRPLTSGRAWRSTISCPFVSIHITDSQPTTPSASPRITREADRIGVHHPTPLPHPKGATTRSAASGVGASLPCQRRRWWW